MRYTIKNTINENTIAVVEYRTEMGGKQETLIALVSYSQERFKIAGMQRQVSNAIPGLTRFQIRKIASALLDLETTSNRELFC
jgi:hypothetical protein